MKNFAILTIFLFVFFSSIIANAQITTYFINKSYEKVFEKIAKDENFKDFKFNNIKEGVIDRCIFINNKTSQELTIYIDSNGVCISSITKSPLTMAKKIVDTLNKKYERLSHKEWIDENSLYTITTVESDKFIWAEFNRRF